MTKSFVNVEHLASSNQYQTRHPGFSELYLSQNLPPDWSPSPRTGVISTRTWNTRSSLSWHSKKQQMRWMAPQSDLVKTRYVQESPSNFPLSKLQEISSTPRGLRRCTTLILGFTNASEILQRVMSMVLVGLARVKWINDHITIYGRTVRDHNAWTPCHLSQTVWKNLASFTDESRLATHAHANGEAERVNRSINKIVKTAIAESRD